MTTAAHEPFLFRAARLEDLDALYSFAKVAGLTNLPADRTLLEAHLRRAIASFANINGQPSSNRFYFFVLEAIHTRQLVGCSAIYSEVGTQTPFYSFKWDPRNETLLLNTDINNVSEMAALYLSPHHRARHLGEFLSRARYLWIAANPDCFHDRLMAEMHGRTDKNKQSPFWEGVVHPFIENKNFEQADREVFLHHTQFIQSCIPRVPISLSKMGKRTLASIGLTHKLSQTAMQLLIKEGFTKTAYVSLFDGGPILYAYKKNIHTIRNGMMLKFAGTKQHVSNVHYLVGTTGMPFYALLAHAEVDLDKGCCYLTPSTAEALSLTTQDTLFLSVF